MRSLKIPSYINLLWLGKGNYMEVCSRGIGSGLSPRCLGLRKRRNFRGIFY